LTRAVPAVVHLVARNLRSTSRTPLVIAVSLFQPLVWLALFSQSLRRMVDYPDFARLGYESYMAYFVPGIVALTVLSTSVRSGVAMVTDINTGMLDKFLISPINRSSILLGRVFADAITMAVQCVTVLLIAVAFGLRSRTGLGGLLLVLALGLWLGLCAAAFSNFVALRTRNPQLTMMVGVNSTLPLMFLSPAFFPTALQPGWLQAAAKVNPVAYAVTAGQDALNTGIDGGHLLAAAGVLALTLALCLTGATRAFQRVTSGALGRDPRRRPAAPESSKAPKPPAMTR